jgi:hypothetical protein
MESNAHLRLHGTRHAFSVAVSRLLSIAPTFAGIVWNEEEVYKQLGGPPNSWSKQTTYRNIIYKYPVAAVDGGNWDPNSVRALLSSL